MNKASIIKGERLLGEIESIETLIERIKSKRNMQLFCGHAYYPLSKNVIGIINKESIEKLKQLKKELEAL